MTELIERIDAGVSALNDDMEIIEACAEKADVAIQLQAIGLLRDCKAALNKYEARQQGLIGSRARLQLEISIAESLIEDPNYEMSAMDCEYVNAWHDKLKAALTQQQEAEPVVVESFRNGRSAVVTGDSVFSLDIGDKLHLHPPKPAAQPQVTKKTCNWKPEIDGEFWSGECGAAWTLNDAGPNENNMHYCPECGGQLEVSAAKEAS